jgi:hypothetical protein
LYIIKLDQRFTDLHVISFTYEQANHLSSRWGWYRDRGFVGFQLDQRLAFADLVAFVDQDLDDVTAFDSFCEKRQFHFHAV